MSFPSTAPDSSENSETHDEDSDVFERDVAIGNKAPDSKVYRIVQEVIPQSEGKADHVKTSAIFDLPPSERIKAVRDKMNKVLKDDLPDFDL